MANCINYKSKDFNDLLNQLGLPQGVLAAKIANWQETNGIDNWPTASDLGYSSKSNITQNINSNNINKNFSQKIQDKLQKLYPEIKLTITNNPVWETGKDVLNQHKYFTQIKYKIKKLKELLEEKDILNNVTFIRGNIPNESDKEFRYSSLEYKGIVIYDKIYPTYKSLVELKNSIVTDKDYVNKYSFSAYDSESNDLIKVNTITALKNIIIDRIEDLKKEMQEAEYIISRRKNLTERKYNPDDPIPLNVQNSARRILNVSFKEYEYLSTDKEALPLIANMANMYAKRIDNDFYNEKDILTEYLAYTDPNAWSFGNGILYIEHPIAQVSFHVFNNQDDIALKFGLNPLGREWSEKEVQFISESLLYDYIKENNLPKVNYKSKNYNKLYEDIETKFINNPNLKKLKNIWLQKNKEQIIGQANIKAMTVLIDAINQKQDTLPHEYAHHYIAWFRDTPIVQEAIKKWGSEEALVQSIGEQVVKQKGEAYNWWRNFVKWIMNKFNSLSELRKENLTRLLTDAFLTRTNLNINNKSIFNNLEYNQVTNSSLQKESPELNQVLTKFLDNIGVKVEVLGEGDFVAKAKIVDKIIQVVQGKADITTLPEEAAHFFVEMLDKNGTIIKQLLTNIENDPLYSQTFEEYKTIYKLPDGSPDIEKIKKEAVGKKLAREIVSLFKSGAIQQQRVSEEINNRSIFMRAWNMITALIKKALNKTGITNFSSYLKNEDITTNVYENVARNILTNDLSGLDLNEPLSDYEMLQASNVTATEIKESLEKFQNRIETGSDKVGNETRHFYTIDKGSENERVIYGTPSLLASQMSRKKSKYRTVSDREKVLWEKIAARGTKVHSWVEECVRANINQYDATSSTLYSGLSDIEKKTFRGVKSQVDLLIKHINEQDPGSIFMTEVGVIDSRMQWLDDNNKSKYGIAGRIDLLVIHPDGTVSIYDWKTTSNKKDLYGIKAFKFFEYLKQVALYKRILMNGDIRYGIPKVKGIRKSRIVQIDTLSDNNDNITQANVVGQIPISGESTGDSIASKNLNHKLETMYEKLEKMIASKPPKDEIERKLFYERMNNLKDTIVDLQLKSNYKKVISNATNDLNYVNTLITQDDLNIDDLREAQEIIDLYTDILEYSDKNDMTPEIRQSFRMISERANELKSIISTKSQEILQLQADNYNIGNLEQTQREVGFLEKNFRSISQVNHPLIAYLHEITKRALYETELESNALRKEIFEHRDKLAKWASGKGMSIQEAYNLIVNKKTGNLISKYNKNYYDLIEKAISNNDSKVLGDAFYIDMAAYNESLEKYKKSIANRVFTTNIAANKSIIDQSIKDYESANTNILTSKFRKVKPDKEDEFLSNEWKVLNSPNNKELKEFYDFFTSKTKELSAWLPNYGYKSNFIPAVRRTFIDEVMRLNNAAATSIYKKVVDKFNPSAVSVNLGSIHGNGEIGGEVPLYFVNGLSADEKSYDLSHVLQLFGEMSYNHKNMSQIETSALAGLNLIQNQKSYERSSTSPLGLVRSNTTANFKVSEEANKGWVEMYKDFMNYFVYDIRTKNPSSLTQFLDTLNQYTAFKYLGLSIFPALAATTANIANTQVQISKNVYFGNKEFSKAIWLLSGGRAMSSKDKDIAYALLEAIDPVIDTRTNAKDRKLKNNIVNRHATSEHFYAMLRKPDELNQKAVTLALLQKSTIDDKGNIVLMSKYLQDLKPFDYYSYPKGSKERNQMDVVIAEKSKNLKSVMDMASLDDKGNLLLDGKVLDKESILQFRQLSRQVNKNIIGNVDPNDIATYKVNAWARSLFLFRNWLPRAIDERYGEVRFNRELNSYEMGRYRTTFNHLFTFIKDEYNNSKWSLLVGVEEAAKAQYYKQLQLRPELEGNLSLNEFVDLYKQNLRASIKGLAITAGVLMLLIIAGKAYDDDDEVTPGEKFTLKVLNRSYTELMMFVNPIEALNILKSPSAATAPLSDLFKVFQHGSMEVFGAVTGDEDYQKRAKPLKYIMTFNPLYGPEKVYREFDESWKDMIEGNEND